MGYHELQFLSWVRWFSNYFQVWQGHVWKSLPNCLMSDKKSFFMVTYTSFYSLHAILCHEYTNPLKIVTSPQLTCDIMRMWGTCIVTSYSSIVLVLANWRKVDLHQWITTPNMYFLSPSIHGIVCKKRGVFWCQSLYITYVLPQCVDKN